MADTYANVDNKSNPAERHFAVVPSNSVDFEIQPRGIYCNSDGTAQVVDAAGTVLPYAMLAGQRIEMRAVRINATGTTGTFYGWY